MGTLVLMGGFFKKNHRMGGGRAPPHAPPPTMQNPVHGSSNRTKHHYLHLANLSLFLMNEIGTSSLLLLSNQFLQNN